MAELNLERWRRLDELFNAAVDLPGDEQSAFVARETLHDAELGRQLAGMLAHGTTAADRISGAIGDSVTCLATEVVGDAATCFAQR